MEHVQKPIATLIPSLDYIHVVCTKCDMICELDYKGLDPSIPLLSITCPTCGDLGTWKLENAGAGFYDRTKD
jgi:hypothetical protein